MIHKQLVKQAISVGDLFDKYLINKIKIEKMNDTAICDSIKKENQSIMNLILELVNGKISKEIQTASDDLYKILQSQWIVLDGVYSLENSNEERGRLALVAQDMNSNRVKYKNIINKLTESSHEFKNYGNIKNIERIQNE